MYLGRRNADLSFLDLRMSNNHKIGEFANSNSTCFIHRLEIQPNYILTDNFDGNVNKFFLFIYLFVFFLDKTLGCSNSKMCIKF